jgi:hypothetical protein
MPVDKQFLTTVSIGDIVVYKMRPEDLPVHPDKEWRGKILRHSLLAKLPSTEHTLNRAWLLITS